MAKREFIRKTRLKKKANQKRVKRWVERALFLLMALSLVLWLGYHLYFFCMSHAIRTVETRPGTLSVGYTATVIVLRNEIVIKALQTGKLVPLIKEGTMARVGNVVSRLEMAPVTVRGQSQTNLVSPQPGLISYLLDGWEGVLVPERWQRLDLLDLFGKVPQQVLPVSGEVNSGAPVFKVIDNLVNPILVLKLDLQRSVVIAEGDRLDVYWDGGSGRAKVLSVSNHPDCLITVAELYISRSALPPQRSFDAHISDQKYQGVILPARALVKKEGKTGVYVRTAVGLKFTTVDVVGQLDEQVAVNGITPGVEVVTNPGVAKRINQEI